MSHRPTAMHCALDWLGRIAASLFVLAFLATGWAYWIEKPWLTYEGVPFEVMGPVQVGAAVPVILTRCNTTERSRTYRVTRRLLNVDTGESFLLPSYEVDIGPGCKREVSRVSVVPPDVPPGVYVLRGLSTAQGRLREHTVPWRTQRFEVVAGPSTSSPNP